MMVNILKGKNRAEEFTFGLMGATMKGNGKIIILMDM